MEKKILLDCRDVTLRLRPSTVLPRSSWKPTRVWCKCRISSGKQSLFCNRFWAFYATIEP